MIACKLDAHCLQLDAWGIFQKYEVLLSLYEYALHIQLELLQINRSAVSWQWHCSFHVHSICRSELPSCSLFLSQWAELITAQSWVYISQPWYLFHPSCSSRGRALRPRFSTFSLCTAPRNRLDYRSLHLVGFPAERKKLSISIRALCLVRNVNYGPSR